MVRGIYLQIYNNISKYIFFIGPTYCRGARPKGPDRQEWDKTKQILLTIKITNNSNKANITGNKKMLRWPAKMLPNKFIH